MLFVYHGNDIPRRRKAVSQLKEQLLEKRPQAEVFEIDADEFQTRRLTELTGSRGLFEDKYVVFLYNVLTTDEGAEAVHEYAEPMGEVEHVFVLIEDDLSGNHHQVLKEYAHSVKELSTGDTSDKNHKPFPLSDAYGRRDAKSGWKELHKALQSSDNTPESIQGLLWWQTRMMWLAKHTDSADEADVSGYPYKKATQFERNFSEQELYDRTKQLITMYHEAHKGEYDLDQALEQFILEI